MGATRDQLHTDFDAAIDRLKEDAWILESSGGRVMRYAHNAERVLAVPAQSVALLAALLLRGPQTVGDGPAHRQHDRADHRRRPARPGAARADLSRRPECAARSRPCGRPASAFRRRSGTKVAKIAVERAEPAPAAR